MPASLSDLQAFKIADQIRIEELTPSYPVIHISNAHATASIALHGAHLTHYTPRGKAPVIFTSKAAIYQEGKAIRGGIPVCWPWFGAHPDSEKNLPAHGYARTTFWKLTSTSSSEEDTRLCFELPAKEGSSLSAKLEFCIRKELILKLTTQNHSDSAQVFSEALHSYFTVGDSGQTHVTGLDGASYIDSTVAENPIKQQSGDISFPSEIDRIYHSPETVIIHDEKNQRQVTATKDNSSSTIIWNPGKEKGAAMTDLLDTETQQFVCAESGNVRDQSITLPPNSSHTLTLTISTQA